MKKIQLILPYRNSITFTKKVKYLKKIELLEEGCSLILPYRNSITSGKHAISAFPLHYNMFG